MFRTWTNNPPTDELIPRRSVRHHIGKQMTAETRKALADLIQADQDAGFFDPPGCEQLRAHINAQRDMLSRVEATLDAILRGQHSGWDRALSDLRDELRRLT